jgi:serine/threonine protein phosphatase PrpC
MELKYWAATDIGRKRADNEDNFLIDKNLHLFVVADGMGGHASGEVASALAVQTIREIVSSEHELIAQANSDDLGWNLEVCILLEHAVHMACERVYQKAQQEPEKRGMGTTVVVLLIAGGRGYIAYVGDSRLYLVRGELVYQLTEDHSLMNELVRRGKIRADEFDDSPYANYKNAMTRAVGPTQTVEVDTLDFDMVPGDAFLLCSDGLYEYLDDQDISKILPLPEIQEVPGQLIEIANRRGGKDNITAIVVQIPRSDEGEDAGAELNYTLDTVRKVPVFADLNYQQLVRVMNVGRISQMQAGSLLCREGQPATALQVILRGRVQLTREDAKIAELGPGQHFGEMSLIDDLPHSTTITCLENGKVLSLLRKDFEAILKREAPLAVKLLRRFVSELSVRLRQTNQALSSARASSIEEISEDFSDEFEMLEEGEVLDANEAEDAAEAEDEAEDEAKHNTDDPGDTQSAGKTPSPVSEDTVANTPKQEASPVDS